jgi:mono/diheme cytochrome c family protein
MNRILASWKLLGMWVVVMVLACGCTDLADPPNRPGAAGSQNCISCHTDQAILQAVAEPDTSSGEEPSGES